MAYPYFPLQFSRPNSLHFFMASCPLTTTIPFAGLTISPPSPGDVPMLLAPSTPPPLQRVGKSKGGRSSQHNLPEDIDLSVFDVLNIFCRRWFLSRAHLVANVISAQKAEDGKITWVEFSPPFHSHLVKCAVALVPRPVPKVKRVMFVFVLELLNQEGHEAFFKLQKGGRKANNAQKEKQCLARKRSCAAKRERERESAKAAQLPPCERHCLGCRHKFTSCKTSKKHKCPNSKVVRIKEVAADKPGLQPTLPAKVIKPPAPPTLPAPTAPAWAKSRLTKPLPSHSTTIPPVTGVLGEPPSFQFGCQEPSSSTSQPKRFMSWVNPLMAGDANEVMWKEQQDMIDEFYNEQNRKRQRC
jgi:hypothetical protein